MKYAKHWLLLIAVMLMAIAAVGCSTIATPTEGPPFLGAPEASVTAPPAPAPASREESAVIRGFQFSPSPLEVSTGTTVVWTNEDNIEHSVTHGIVNEPGAAFDSGLFTQGQSFSFTFAEPGSYAYFCTRHTFMQGEVRVEDVG